MLYLCHLQIQKQHIRIFDLIFDHLNEFGHCNAIYYAMISCSTQAYYLFSNYIITGIKSWNNLQNEDVNFCSIVHTGCYKKFIHTLCSLSMCSFSYCLLLLMRIYIYGIACNVKRLCTVHFTINETTCLIIHKSDSIGCHIFYVLW